MAVIDTHTHLESFIRKGMIEGTLERARAAGVSAMITIGTAPDDWAVYRDLAVKHRGFVHYSVGLHPCSVDANWAPAVTQIEAFWTMSGQDAAPNQELARAARVSLAPVALGECGLDRFHLPKDTGEAEQVFRWQQDAFMAQLAIARRLACPLVVHSRGAFRECVEMIDASSVEWGRVVFHCFTEGEAEMGELIRRGGLGSFTGILTYKNAEAIRAAAKAQGLDRFMLETDAPYLTPLPHRGKPNEPAFVRHTAEFAATEVFRIPLEELEATSTANARRFFAL